MEKNTEKNSFTLRENADIGSVKIANDVIAMIAGLAALEIEGVSAIAGGLTADSLTRGGYQKLSKGVKVALNGNQMKISLALMMNYGYNIQTTCQKAQTRIKSTVENMTGLEVLDVNIRITGITMPQ